MSTLYVLNLLDRKLYALDVSSGDTTDVTIVQAWNTPDGTGAGRHRPMGLAWHNGQLWIGSVDENGSNAYVHALDPAGTTFTLAVTVPLSYTRQDWIWDPAPNLAATWHGWSADPTTLTYQVIDDGGEIAYPQPMLAAIEFDGDDMIWAFVIALATRWGRTATFGLAMRNCVGVTPPVISCASVRQTVAMLWKVASVANVPIRPAPRA
ncbi:MAG: hypothetical protein R2867_16235 [Caldilineaceae bacterium]